MTRTRRVRVAGSSTPHATLSACLTFVVLTGSLWRSTVAPSSRRFGHASGRGSGLFLFRSLTGNPSHRLTLLLAGLQPAAGSLSGVGAVGTEARTIARGGAL